MKIEAVARGWESHRVGKLKIEAAARKRDNGKRKGLHLELEKRQTHLWILCVAAYDGEASERKRDRKTETERRKEEKRGGG